MSVPAIFKRGDHVFWPGFRDEETNAVLKPGEGIVCQVIEADAPLTPLQFRTFYGGMNAAVAEKLKPAMIGKSTPFPRYLLAHRANLINFTKRERSRVFNVVMPQHLLRRTPYPVSAGFFTITTNIKERA